MLFRSETIESESNLDAAASPAAAAFKSILHSHSGEQTWRINSDQRRLAALMAEQPNGQGTLSKDFQLKMKAKQIDVQNGSKLRAMWEYVFPVRDILTTFGHRFDSGTLLSGGSDGGR